MHYSAHHDKFPLSYEYRIDDQWTTIIQSRALYDLTPLGCQKPTDEANLSKKSCINNTTCMTDWSIKMAQVDSSGSQNCRHERSIKLFKTMRYNLVDRWTDLKCTSWQFLHLVPQLEKATALPVTNFWMDCIFRIMHCHDCASKKNRNWHELQRVTTNMKNDVRRRTSKMFSDCRALPMSLLHVNPL